jgi:hypothetical protein
MLAKITSGGGIHGQVITIGGNACGISPSSVSGFLEISTGQGIKLNSGAAFCAIFNSSGNVGIGTTNPTERLHVVGNALITGTISASGGTMSVASWGADAEFLRAENQVIGGIYNSLKTKSSFSIQDNSISFHIDTGAASQVEVMRLVGNGNVGIGTTAPDKVLEVNLGTTSAFRLTHNDSNGSATTYMDTTVSSSGQTKFMATGSAPSFTFVGNSTTLSGSVYTSVSSASLEVLGIESRTPAGSSGSINERTYQFRVATTGSEVVPIYIRQIPAETVMGFDIVVVSRRTGSPVASGSAEDAGFFKILSQYNNIGGVATIVGSDTLVYSQSSQGTWAASTSSDGSDGVLLNVTGAEVNDIIWHATVKTYSVVF